MAKTKFYLTDEIRDTIIDYADVSYTDTDMNRDAETREVDALVGETAEQIAAEFFRSHGHNVSPSNNYKYDMNVDGSLIEVKGRKTWDFSEPDLLIRTKFDLSSDIYLQVDLHLSSGNQLKADLSNLEYGEVVGYATKEIIEQDGEPFNQHYDEKENPTQLVDRSDLLDPNRISRHIN